MAVTRGTIRASVKRTVTTAQGPAIAGGDHSLCDNVCGKLTNELLQSQVSLLLCINVCWSQRWVHIPDYTNCS